MNEGIGNEGQVLPGDHGPQVGICCALTLSVVDGQIWGTETHLASAAEIFSTGMAALHCCPQCGGKDLVRWMHRGDPQGAVVTAHRGSTVPRGLAGLEVRQEIVELPPR